MHYLRLRARPSITQAGGLVGNVENSEVAEHRQQNQLPCLAYVYVTISPEFQFRILRTNSPNMYKGPLQNEFSDITSSILLIAFMSLYFSILFLSIIILCSVFVLVLCCSRVSLIASRFEMRKEKTFLRLRPQLVKGKTLDEVQ